MARLDDLLALVDDALAGHESTKAEVLTLVADDDWCRKALGRRGIEVPSTQQGSSA